MGPKRKKTDGPIIVKKLPMMDPALIRYDSTIALIGPRKCGKTSSLYQYLLKVLLRRGLVMCPTPEIYKAYQSFLRKLLSDKLILFRADTSVLFCFSSQIMFVSMF